MDHVGGFVELVLIRRNSVSPIQLKMKVVEVAPDQMNRSAICFVLFVCFLPVQVGRCHVLTNIDIVFFLNSFIVSAGPIVSTNNKNIVILKTSLNR